MKSPPARAGPQGHHLVAGDGSARRMAQVQVSVNQLWQSRCRARMAGRSSPASGTRWWWSKAMWVRPGWMRGSVCWVLLVLGRDVKNTGSRPVSELQTTSPRSFLLKPMTVSGQFSRVAPCSCSSAQPKSGCERWTLVILTGRYWDYTTARYCGIVIAQHDMRYRNFYLR